MDRKCGSAFESFTVFRRIWKTSLKSVEKGEKLRKTYIQKLCLTGGLSNSWEKPQDATSILTDVSPVNITQNFKLHKLTEAKATCELNGKTHRKREFLVLGFNIKQQTEMKRSLPTSHVCQTAIRSQTTPSVSLRDPTRKQITSSLPDSCMFARNQLYTLVSQVLMFQEVYTHFDGYFRAEQHSDHLS